MSVELDQELIDAICDIPWPTSAAYIPASHAPEIPQHAFLTLECLDALYGGAAGGGKSDALLMAALQYVDVPGYAAILLRKTYTELMLENALLDRANKWLASTPAKWNGESMRWTFPSGATVSFGYLKNLQDRARYQSAEYQFIGFDELTAFDEGDFRFMFSRCRGPGICPTHNGALGRPRAEGVYRDGRLACEHCGNVAPPAAAVPLRVRGATNPGGRGHKWVYERYIQPWEKRQIYVDKTGSPSRIFIPAKLADNPHIDAESYIQALEELEPELKDQLLGGDWHAREPGEWMIPDQRWIDAAEEFGRQMWDDGPPPPAGELLSVGVDWGEHTAAYVIWPLEAGGVLIPPSEVVSNNTDPVVTTHRIIRTMLRFGYPVGSVRYDAAGVQSNRTFTNIARKMPGLDRLRTTAVPFNKYKHETIGYLRTLFRRAFAGEHVRIIAIHPSNTELLRQLRGWQRKVDKFGEGLDEAVKTDDHGPDAVVAGIAPIAAKHRAFIERELSAAIGDGDDAFPIEGSALASDSMGGYIAS